MLRCKKKYAKIMQYLKYGMFKDIRGVQCAWIYRKKEKSIQKAKMRS